MTRGAELRRVLQEGKRFRTAHLEVRAIASPLGFPRVGFIVPRHRRSAVERNRLKRRLRELVRIRLLGRLPSMDMVIRASPGAYRAGFEALQQELDRAGAQAARSFVE